MPRVNVPVFDFPSHGEFVGRSEQLASLEKWWAESSGEPINLFGRRRVGKSWLFRKLAHGKKAIIIVPDQSTQPKQLAKIAEQLEPVLGVRPDIKDVGALFRVLYKIADAEKVLVVIDEFPYLLGTSKKEITKSLSEAQKAIEECGETSKIKLILCGSAMAQMEAMQELKNPMYGRLRRFELPPMTFHESRGFFQGTNLPDHLTRYSIAGGMPKYLARIGTGDLATVLVDEIVSINAPLYAEVESFLAAELRDPGIYFAILEQLVVRPKESGEIATAIGKTGASLSEYFKRLEALRIIGKKSPVGASPNSRSQQWECLDGFTRFYFRFVFPYKSNLESGGASAKNHVQHHVLPFISEHVSLEFEKIFRRWVNQNYSGPSLVGNWWGKSLPGMAHATEEIDILGLKGKKVVIAGEAKWQKIKLKQAVYDRLVNDKLPAAVASGLTVSAPDVIVILASLGGFTTQVVTSASNDHNIHLVDALVILRDVV